MRHTLIPKELRRSLRHEYRVRTLTVFLLMLSIAGIIGVVSVLPAYIHAMLEENAAARTLAPLKTHNSEASTTDTSGDIKRQTKVLAIIDNYSKFDTDYSTIISGVVGSRGPIKIVGITTDRVGTTTITTTVQGIAPNRDALLAFKNRLGQVIPSTSVDLPVSQLAKSKDIQFSLSMTSEIKL